MAVTGDYGKLRALLLSIDKVTGAPARRDLNRGLGKELLGLVRQGFQQGQAPGGEAWTPLKARQGQPLVDSGRLMRSLRATTTNQGAVIASDLPYAAAQNYGATLRHDARVNAHSRKGRFITRKAAERRKTAVRVSYSAGRTSTLPARPFLPSGGLSPAWTNRVTRVVDDWVRGFFA